MKVRTPKGGMKYVAAAAAASLLLAGCGPLISFGDDGPADEVYSLAYAPSGPAIADDAPIIYVDEPLLAQGLGGVNVAVALDDNRRTSLMGVRWAENSSDLIRDYLVRAAGEKSGARLLGEGGLDVRAGCKLALKVWSFDFAPGASSRDDEVRVEIEFTLVRYSDNHLLGQPTFRDTQSVRSADSDRIVAAFHNAMGTVSDAAGDWLRGAASACAIDAETAR